MIRAVLDDHPLRDLLADEVGDELGRVLADYEPATTNLYLLRLCKSAVAAERLAGPLCVWVGDDGPRIRAAVGSLKGDYRTVSR